VGLDRWRANPGVRDFRSYKYGVAWEKIRSLYQTNISGQDYGALNEIVHAPCVATVKDTERTALNGDREDLYLEFYTCGCDTRLTE